MGDVKGPLADTKTKPPYSKMRRHMHVKQHAVLLWWWAFVPSRGVCASGWARGRAARRASERARGPASERTTEREKANVNAPPRENQNRGQLTLVDEKADVSAPCHMEKWKNRRVRNVMFRIERCVKKRSRIIVRDCPSTQSLTIKM